MPRSVVACARVVVPLPLRESSVIEQPRLLAASLRLRSQHSCSLSETASSFFAGPVTSGPHPRAHGATHHKRSCPPARTATSRYHAKRAGTRESGAMDRWIAEVCNGHAVMVRKRKKTIHFIGLYTFWWASSTSPSSSSHPHLIQHLP